MAAQTVVLITGANSGIGYAASKVIAASSPNYHVIMTGRNLAKVEAAQREIQSSEKIKGKLSSMQLEVTDEASIAAAAKKVEQEFGRLDVLINNAGITGYGEPSLKNRLQAVLMANVAGPLLVSEAFSSLVLKSKNPRSIFVSSGLGSLAMTADPNNARYHDARWQVYRTSKAGLDMVAVTEGNKYAAKGMKTWTVCPGLVKSNLRGTKPEEISAAGNAGDPDVSGRLMLDIIEGKRDADAGGFVHGSGQYPW